GVLSDDEVLLSIINKSLSLIDAKQMHTLILDVASHIDRKITLDAVFDNYGTEILITALIVLSILLFSVFSNIRVSNKLREQNRKYEVLSQISNEYLYEYFVKEKHLKLYDKFNELFNTQESIEEVVTILKNSFSNHNNDWLDNIIRLPLPDGKVGIFKVINTNIYDVKGRTECIIGKLIDVSAEVAEKEELLIKSQIDELTGLNNAATTKELIIERIELKQDHVTDAFILIDCDNFKEINDTHGHLVGNQVLEHIAMMMKQTYRKTDILGRVGGDEFCIYMKEIPSVTFVQKKSQKLSDLIRTTIDKMSFSISMGIVLICKKEPYEVIFKKADTALYQAKSKGKAQSIIYCEHEK
ncbi:MAG: GGDEF domain-containing protein, partial [Clostridiaceae bacterium]|nr:GGDEF domain-containing protein [Clostridiaceae bacterium]